MKRDMDLVRKILLALEEHSEADSIFELTIPDCEQEVVGYHVMLMAEGGLIQAEDVSDMTDCDWWPRRLTWAGHDFLDSARDNSIWNRAKAKIGSTIGSASFDVFKSLLVKFGSEAMDL